MSVSVHATGLDRVAVISSLVPDFDALARPLLGRVSDIGLRLKPMLVLVSNESAETVVAFSKTWHVFYRGGRAVTHRDNTIFPHAVCGDVIASDQPAGIAPGVKHLEARGLVIHGWGTSGDPYFDQFLPQFVVENERMLANAIELRIELNAVIFADGTLIGPDEDGWLEQIFSTYVGEKQNWYRLVIDRLDKGETIAEAFKPVEQFMAEHTARRRSGERPFTRDDADFWRVQAASDALRMRRRTAADKTGDLLRTTIRLDPFVIRRPSGG
jgi:hypothetical protein